ncbi:MAG: chloride channel protein [Cyanobacteria bacterium]|nr:chloride channel protein [Cyanobacteriota bacterium]
MRCPPVLIAALKRLLPIVVLGLAVGVACWPLNLLDRAQDQLLQLLPRFAGGGWRPLTVAMASAPLLVMPLLLWLQAGVWSEASGSGIPQAMVALEQPKRAEMLLAPQATVQRLMLWSVATLALLPLGREGPVVHVGAAVAHSLRQRFPRWLQPLDRHDLIALAGGAGLAAGFNTPIVGMVFVAEELTSSFGARLIWPTLLACVTAAGISNLGGQPEFALGLLHTVAAEPWQLFWAIPLGISAGLLGAVFGRLLLETTRWLSPRARSQPLRVGLVLGLLLSGLTLASGGFANGDGEALMGWMIGHPEADLPTAGLLLARLVGPCLALGAGVPGGLIDPAFAIGAVVGQGAGQLLGLGMMGLALGMAAALAGATQLPVLSVVFALRLAGDQQLLPGVVLAAVIGAYCSRLLMKKPVYHALAANLE